MVKRTGIQHGPGRRRPHAHSDRSTLTIESLPASCAVSFIMIVLLMSRWRISRGRLWGSDLEDVPFVFEIDRNTARRG